MHYLIISFTHKNTNIQTREQLSFQNDLEKEQFLSGVIDCMYVNEAIVLSTCNRIEFISSVSDIQKAKDTLFETIAQKSEISKIELVQRADIHENENAVHHLFSVVSSLDSLVVGETQIAGQFKQAYHFSKEKGFCSQKLSRVAQYAFKCASLVRSATTLGTGSVSVASTAALKAKEIYGSNSGETALVVGAGEMSELAIRHLIRHGFEVILLSRNYKKAKLLAQSIQSPNLQVKRYGEIQELLSRFKILFTATSAPYPIIKKQMVTQTDFERHWFDIALPRDIEDFDFPKLHIYSVDDLQDVVNENLHLRAEQAKVAYTIVKEKTQSFYLWLSTLGVEPAIKSLHLMGNDVALKKVRNALSKGFVPKEYEQNITKLCQSVITEFLHTPTKNLREFSGQNEFDDLLETLQTIFEIKEDRLLGGEFENYKCKNR